MNAALAGLRGIQSRSGVAIAGCPSFFVHSATALLTDFAHTCVVQTQTQILSRHANEQDTKTN